MPPLSRRRGNNNSNTGRFPWRRESYPRLLVILFGICVVVTVANYYYQTLFQHDEDYGIGATPRIPPEVAIGAITTPMILKVQASSQSRDIQDPVVVESPPEPLIEGNVQASSQTPDLTKALTTEQSKPFDIVGMPQRPLPGTGFTTGDKKILVVYSGPTEFADPETVREPSSPAQERLKELYRLNFEYFLKYGVQCRTQDTLVIVTSVVQQRYQPQIDALHIKCQEHGHQVIMATRNNTCWDLETVRRVMHDDIVDLNQYDYFVYVNCGTSGPSRLWADLPWTDLLLERLNAKVKMSGLTLSCATSDPHIQSMVYALD